MWLLGVFVSAQRVVFDLDTSEKQSFGIHLLDPPTHLWIAVLCFAKLIHLES
jgi:hypothetical protein